ncbi:MAG: DUF1538 domain-containing protein [Proteobacteria bacterium]|nr:DUF1538 domain-containing protein [Pseudomonadota bacterium]
MTEVFILILTTLRDTVVDLAPINAIVFIFQYGVIRRPLPHLRQVLFGFGYVLLGLSLFLVGLEEALLPLGRAMARQLTAPEFLGALSNNPDWTVYLWVYAFAAFVGFASTLAEPSLIAVSLKAETVSAGTVTALGLRLAVAAGVALGVALGAFRIVSGIPLYYFIIAGYAVVVIQTIRVNRSIIPLAYDSGGVTTSSVTVPLLAALGLGLASTIPGRDPLTDGFGLIAFASLFPIMTVMGYAQIGAWWRRRSNGEEKGAHDEA